MARCLGMEPQRGQTMGRGRGRGGKAQAGTRGDGFYIPETTQGHETTKSAEGKPPPKSRGLYIGAQEQETMRAFAEVVRRVLERDTDGDGEGEGRGVKRKVEWGV